MPLLSDETIRASALEAFVKAIRDERDPWRQARLLAFVRKQRDHSPLCEVAAELFEKEMDLPPEERRCYWPTLELLTKPSAQPPAEGPLWIEPVSDVCLVRIPAGTFLMGSNFGENDEMPVHEVEITQDYWLGRHPVTNGEFNRYLTADPPAAITSPPRKPDRLIGLEQPVVAVSWVDCENGYCAWLRQATGLSGMHLPTEAEWEKACRGGTNSRYFFGGSETELHHYAWFHDPLSTYQQTTSQPLDGYLHTLDNSPHTSGKKRPNQFGLCDMSGQVLEWCWDTYHVYSGEKQTNPNGPPFNLLTYVCRGGSRVHPAIDCRSSRRFGFPSNQFRYDFIGFRLAYNTIPRSFERPFPKIANLPTEFALNVEGIDLTRDKFSDPEPFMITSSPLTPPPPPSPAAG